MIEFTAGTAMSSVPVIINVGLFIFDMLLQLPTPVTRSFSLILNTTWSGSFSGYRNVVSHIWICLKPLCRTSRLRNLSPCSCITVEFR